MPELPEVETVVRTLEMSLLGEEITSIDVHYPKLLEVDSKLPLEALQGMRFKRFHRRGKYLCFEMDSGYSWIVHLRMEGKFNLYQHPVEATKHTHLVFQTENHTVHYLDTRKFSRMALVENVEAYFVAKGLGLEPWDEMFTPDFLYKKLKGKSQAIKATLLDQSIVVGLGNIYADEVLFDTKIHPKTSSNKITLKQCKELVPTIQATLSRAIQAGGTTVRSYTSSLNVNGLFQINLKAYGRYGQPCLRCGTNLDKIKVAGRTSVFCTRCQRVKL